MTLTFRKATAIGLAFGLMTLAACINIQLQSASQQRRTAEVAFDDAVRIILQSGTFRSVDAQPIVARSASLELDMIVRAGPAPDGVREFEIRNIAPDATVRVSTVSILASDTEDGCELGDTRTVSCEIDPTFELCGDIPFTKSADAPTTFFFEYDPVPCRELQFSLSADVAPTETLTVAVLGSTEELDALDEFAAQAVNDDADFLVILGDAAADTNEAALNDLEARTNLLPLPVILIAGDREQGIESGDPFLRRFGPHEQTWNYKGAKFFTFFSANGSVGDDGIDRLDRALAQLQRRGDATQPIVGFTHVPPIDPNGTRDSGFRNQLEGGRVQGILNRYDVAMLFAGETHDPDFSESGGFQLVLPGAGSATLSATRRFVLLTINHQSVGSSGRQVGEWFLNFESKQF